ncbi:PREDICTED: peroxidase skpo-1-like [Acropora digitifera]|uniref:peroxidase skpo-1-like n=1 Tax=Acropora digitifera TaxID=70779 RepID=UPI00077A453E|nr:PREDICTED: peroxidase skpo-1-like [Acropora digitifera]
MPQVALKWLLYCVVLTLYLAIIFPPTDAASCEDHHPRCGNWAAKGECKKNPKWMLKHCKVSCGKCSQANVHDLYNQASLETYGSLLLLAVIPIAAILGALVKAHYEGPSCPSSAKLEGRS